MMLLTWLGGWLLVSVVLALVWVALVSASRRTGPALTARSVERHAEHERQAHPTVVALRVAGDHAA